MHYLKFFCFHVYALIGIAALAAGGMWISLALLVTTASIILADLILGDDISEPNIKHNWPYNLQLWLALPLITAVLLAGLYQFGTLFGTDAETNPLIWASAVIYTGLLVGTLGTVTAHELIHRRWGSFSHSVGRWLLAYSFDSNFAIEHVFGHHIHIATARDPASAPRGRTLYRHILLSTINGNISAWQLECKRLRQQRLQTASIHNRFIRGVLLSVLLMTAALALAGWCGWLFLVLAGFTAKALLETINYIEHYGLVRLPGKRVYPRHSWNSNHTMSSWILFNLTRHSHHHANAKVPFQHLQPIADAPMMPAGYLGTLGLALYPPLWFKIMQPRLARWDQEHASEAELAYLRRSDPTQAATAPVTNTASNPPPTSESMTK